MSSATRGEVYWGLLQKFPELAKEYQSIKILEINNVISPMTLMTTKPFKSLQDLKGMRIKCTADVIPVLKSFGAEGVLVPMPRPMRPFRKGLSPVSLVPQKYINR